MNPDSLRLRLLVGLLTAFLMGWLLVAVVTFVNTHHEVEELFDAQLAQSARVLHTLMGPAMDEVASGEIDPAQGMDLHDHLPGHPYEKHIAFQVWSEGALVMRSSSAPTSPMGLGRGGFENRVIDGDTWRVFVLRHRPHGFVIHVGERYRARNELAFNTMVQVLLPLALGVPGLGALIWVMVGQGLQPLRRLAEEVGRRSPRELDPVSLKQTPQEAVPLVTALNTLLARLAQALDSERRFTADAAHELRTPLASLKVQAQVALRARSPEERNRALNHILTGVDRANHLVAQLLTLARLDPDSVVPHQERVDLAQVAEEVLATVAHEALEKEVELELDAPRPVAITGYATGVAVLLRNLVNNAIRHTPAGGRVVVSLSADHQAALLVVEDSGPGIPPSQRQEMFKRFRRGQQPGGVGCGLGLSIVQRICELHQGSIRLEASAMGGLRAVAALPLDGA